MKNNNQTAKEKREFTIESETILLNILKATKKLEFIGNRKKFKLDTK